MANGIRPSTACGLAAVLLALIAAPLGAAPMFISRSANLPVDQRYEGGWAHFVGGGVAVLDCDGDALPDFYAAGGAAPSRLFRNISEPGGEVRFAQADIQSIDAVTGAYPMDVDGDGTLDLVILRHGANVILRGKGDCAFAPAPDDWGFDGGAEWTTAFSATFERGQSWPTLVFGNYVDETNPDGPFEACERNYLLRPDGRAFAPRQPFEPGFCALSMLISDWQRNGQPDLRISNDRQYYVRNGREQMWHLSPLAEYGDAEGWPIVKLWGMGIASRDLNGDGLPEIMLTSMGDQMLQINAGAGNMASAPYGIGTYATTPYTGDDGRPSTGWHAEFGDVDNDGRDDLFIAKGNVDQMPSNAIHDPNNLLMQQPDGHFVEMGAIAGIATGERSRGAALVDLNLDGRLDILVVNRRAPLEIWENTTPDSGHWLALDVRQDGANTWAVGAFVEVRLPDGRILTQEITIGGGHASGDATSLHFGLGAAPGVDLRVIWPDQQASNWTPVGINVVLTVTRGADGFLDVTAGG